MHPSLKGRIAVVTGAAGALGQATAQRLQDCGATVVAVIRSDSAPASLADMDVRSCDLAQEAAVQPCFHAILETHGRIDVLANIAGGFAMGARVEDTTAADWLAMLSTNAATAWLACKYALPAMRREDFGRIVNVGARAAAAPAAKMAPYCASKAVVATLTQVIARECANTGITANCILPGTIDTPRNRADMPQADHGRWIPPQELACVVAQLADPESGAVNGAIIPAYGRS